MVKTKTASARGSSDSLVTLECFITGGPSVFFVPWCSLLAFLLRLRFIFLFFSFFLDRNDARFRDGRDCYGGDKSLAKTEGTHDLADFFPRFFSPIKRASQLSTLEKTRVLLG